MKTSEIQAKVQGIIQNLISESFIYDFLIAYGTSRAAIERLRNGNLNISKRKHEGEVLWKKNIFYRSVKQSNLRSEVDQIVKCDTLRKSSPKFIIVSDNKTLLAIDTRTQDKLEIPIVELSENFDFFLPLAGIEKASIHKESETDVKAAERMAKIYEEICKLNPNMKLKQKDAAALNAFLSRLLFCYFAESTEIFSENQFSKALNTHTMEDGTDLQQFFDELFGVLNKRKDERNDGVKWLRAFPYVNGGLFKERFRIPKLSRRLRNMIIESGKLDWSSINPDIFGSMIQAVADPNQRSSLGMHYTSVSNIMKVIRPLFLDELYEKLERAKGNKKKLNQLYGRLGKIRIFDPACGSGNFLIIAYKELRLFEIQLLKQLEAVGENPTFLSQIRLSQFYGIEIDEFACEIAKLSLWLAEHQMNRILQKTFGKSVPSLPLKEGGHIVCGNATRLDWEEVCPKNQQAEIYLTSNPPYLGTRNQTSDHKEDMSIVFRGIKNYKNLDYISCWFYKGADYIKKTGASLAFVSTSSISQGDQVSLLWPHILSKDIEIGFCHQPFKWTNNAKNKAGVSCIIIGLRPSSNNPKIIFNETHANVVDTINPYLTSGKRRSVARRSKPISKIPEMIYGSEPRENGYLMLEEAEKEKLLLQYPEAKRFLKKVTGSNEFINNIQRWCLWVTDTNVEEAELIPPIKQRFQKVRAYRKGNSRKDTVKFADKPYRFTSITHKDTQSILVPIVSSDLRDYIPCGFLDGSFIILNSAQVIHNADPLVFGILSSKLHLAWVRATAGQLETRIRYSSAICYNNFPFPEISKKQKEQIHSHVLNVLSEREKHPDKTIAELYDPQKMPAGLREAHRNLDVAVERCYRSKPFENDEERLEHLFKLYEEMTQNEKKGT